MYVIPPMLQREKRRNQLICRGPRCWNQKKRLVDVAELEQPVEINEVWSYNLEEEFTKIRSQSTAKPVDVAESEQPVEITQVWRSYNLEEEIRSQSTAKPVDVAEPEQPVEITQVWCYNLEEEFTKIKWALQNGYGVVGLDTEFPGAPFVPDDVSLDYRERSKDDHYAVMKLNVERTKIIQVGITLSDELGNLPTFGNVRVAWEFNFSDFDAEIDECNKDSTALLEKQGIDFQKHKKHGISSTSFAYFMGWSGLIGVSRAWITFQGGVDLAYLLKMVLENNVLPDDLWVFNACVNRSFGPYVFDVKHMMTHCQLYGGLDKVATSLKVDREAGQSHRAGSDSLLTIRVFQRIQQLHFQEPEALDTVAGKLHNFV